ncbi:glycosyltransferase family 2 protein [Bacteriovorax sp. Seq25_V]|uniref:glycosyltransferase family 2 protein n=1 Tax=Bacteriovorax sp. Seq25_V TaxID=1201288 RepID=UPI00038A0869|nr:glycosyltransferase family 2 protein [Bacteriovorax sp. Seq25_V]EQC43203.1 glycosyltransferase, group 2 family protein [Bacteriovorax sp. Seq25_V]
MFSVVIPVYMNELNIPPLLDALIQLNNSITNLEVVFVVDGSPDRSYLILKEKLQDTKLNYQLISHSRNFGSFAAIHTGLKFAKGDHFGVMAADLQEPPELMIDFHNSLISSECDITIGTRETRNDPFFSEVFSKTFWFLYKKFVIPDLPPGGVDIFGCNRRVRDQLCKLEELNTSLIGLLYWIGFKRKVIPYTRQEREIGVSAWTFKRKLKYLMDSIFAFTDLPIRLLTNIGIIALLSSIFLAIIIIIAKLSGAITVPGYAATVLIIMFFASLNSIGLAIIGNYTWRAYENTKKRPVSITIE